MAQTISGTMSSHSSGLRVVPACAVTKNNGAQVDNTYKQICVYGGYGQNAQDVSMDSPRQLVQKL